MKSIAFALVILATSLPAQEREKPKFSAEFKLKAKGKVEELMIGTEYQITIEGGTATLKYTREGKPQTDTGSVTLTILSGIDPATKRPAKFVGFLRIDAATPGWVRDKFITRIEIPLEVVQGQSEARLRFGDTATIDRLWRDDLSNGITRYSDPMGVRIHSDYSVEVIRSPLK
jgi:hypothetical protein